MAMAESCPQASVRSILQGTKRLFVLGFSTTGGGHERLTAVLTEHLRGEQGLDGVTLLVSMPEPWKGEMLADGSVPQEKRQKVDHTQSILGKLSPLLKRHCRLIFVRALKSVTGFYTTQAGAAAKELMLGSETASLIFRLFLRFRGLGFIFRFVRKVRTDFD